MDANQTLADIYRMLNSAEWFEVLERINDLLNWLNSGGFVPGGWHRADLIRFLEGCNLVAYRMGNIAELDSPYP